MQPLADNGNCFVRILVGNLTHLLHRLGVDLALDLGKVDHLRCLIGVGLQRAAACDGRDRVEARIDRRTVAQHTARRQRRHGALVRRDDAAHQRPHHHEQDDETKEAHHHHFDGAHDVVLGELERRQPAARLGDRRGRRLGEAQIDDLDLVAALLAEADCRAHQGGDLVELFLAARLIGAFALVVLAIGAVNQDRDRDAIEPAAFEHLGLGGLGNLVVTISSDLRLSSRDAAFSPPGAGWRAPPGISLPTVTWFSLPSLTAEVSSRVWLERTTRPSGSYLSEVWVTRLKSKSAATSTRAWFGPTTDDTIASTWLRKRFSNAACRSSVETSPPFGSLLAPSARS